MEGHRKVTGRSQGGLTSEDIQMELQGLCLENESRVWVSRPHGLVWTTVADCVEGMRGSTVI